jgi:flagellar secretion chaperone FliS
MSDSSARGAPTYFETQVQSRLPLDLVVMLYGGALRHTRDMRRAIERRDLVAKKEAVARALAIITELQSTLNRNAGGQIAPSLDRIHNFVFERLLEANARADVLAVDDALRVLAPLRDAWAQLAASEAVPARKRKTA